MLPPVQVQVQDVPNNDMDDILAVMAQTGEPLNKTEAMATINRYNAAVVNITQKGETVSTDLFKTNLSMQAGAILKDAVTAGEHSTNGVYFVDNDNKAHKAPRHWWTTNPPDSSSSYPCSPKANTPCKYAHNTTAEAVYSRTPSP